MSAFGEAATARRVANPGPDPTGRARDADSAGPTGASAVFSTRYVWSDAPAYPDTTAGGRLEYRSGGGRLSDWIVPDLQGTWRGPTA